VESGEVKLRKTEEFRAATVLYTGRCGEWGVLSEIDSGDQADGAGDDREEREFTVYFEGMEIAEQYRAGAGGGEGEEVRWGRTCKLGRCGGVAAMTKDQFWELWSGCTEPQVEGSISALKINSSAGSLGNFGCRKSSHLVEHFDECLDRGVFV